MFDRVLVADWSAAARPTRAGPDAIWIGEAGGAAACCGPRHFATRRTAEAAITEALAAALAAGQRALLGLDFAFGYPAGFAARLTGRAEAPAVWAELAARVADGPDNANTRFAAAAGINARFGGTGPFWGHPPGRPLPGLPARRAALPEGLAAHRIVETRLRAAAGPGRAVKSAWQLCYAGAVGGQVLVGLPFLDRLSRRFGDALSVWPFQSPGRQLVVAEVYPALIDPAVAASTLHRVRDARQAQLLAEALAALAADDALAPLLSLPADLSGAEARIVRSEEGWILGAGHAAALVGALSRTSRRRGRSA